MIAVEHIRATVAAYLQRYPDEVERLAALSAALDDGGDLTSRTTFTGHVTCSAAVCDPAGRVLHIRHNVLKRWLRPGGHLEPADGALVGAAVREVGEETGIPAVALRLVDEVPVDIDVHPIPANAGRDEPDHWHFDLCFAFTTAAAPEVRLQAEEVHDFRWQPAAATQPGWLVGRITAVLAREAIVRADS